MGLIAYFDRPNCLHIRRVVYLANKFFCQIKLFNGLILFLKSVSVAMFSYNACVACPVNGPRPNVNVAYV